jgi:hypothetical protein
MSEDFRKGSNEDCGRRRSGVKAQPATEGAHRRRLAGGAEQARLKKYAVGLEISCPGGVYYWAPKIPSSRGDSRHRRANVNWLTIGHDFSRRARAQVRTPTLLANWLGS